MERTTLANIMEQMDVEIDIAELGTETDMEQAEKDLKEMMYRLKESSRLSAEAKLQMDMIELNNDSRTDTERIHLVNEQIADEERVYWSLIGHDDNDNAIIKVYKSTEEFEAMIERGKQKEASKQKSAPKVTLKEAEKFDKLIDVLIKEEVTYVVPNRRTGNNVRIDYAKIDNKGKKGNNGHTGTKTTTVTKTTTLVITEAGALG